ncbi:MAG: hypothetical protein ACK44W_16600 [Planctomycetota bacterium]
MTTIPAWIVDPAILRGIGLRLQTVRRFGDTARWISCRRCGEGLVALFCTNCGWSLETYALACAHLARLRSLDPLYLFACRNGCNRTLVEDPPPALLHAQAAEAAAQNVERAPRPGRKARVMP